MSATERFPGLKDTVLAIFDVDQTLVFPDNPDFYAQYGTAVEQAIGTYFEVEPERADEIADFYRQHYGGGQEALFRGDLHQHYPDIAARAANTAVLYDAMSTINPAGQFSPQPEIRAGIQAIREQGVITVALTSSPDRLSRAILEAAGYEPDNDFDLFEAYKRETGPPKMVRTDRIFEDIADSFGVKPEHTLAVGDSLAHDVLPALALGMRACWLTSSEAPADYHGFVAEHPLEIISALQEATAPR